MAFRSIGGAGNKRSSVKAELPLSEHSGKLGTEPTGGTVFVILSRQQGDQRGRVQKILILDTSVILDDRMHRTHEGSTLRSLTGAPQDIKNRQRIDYLWTEIDPN